MKQTSDREPIVVIEHDEDYSDAIEGSGYAALLLFALSAFAGLCWWLS